MKKSIFWQLLGLTFVLILSGCAVRTYTVVKDRVDQDLTKGNRGYIMGKAPQATENPQRQTTRTTYVTEIELPALNKFGHKPKPATAPGVSAAPLKKSETPEQGLTQNLEKYKVVSGDTLEKISKKFYGTTKKWAKIYEANKDKLKAPNKIYPGQVLDIPVENIKK